MNKSILICAFIAINISVFAQEFQGKAEYFSKTIRKTKNNQIKTKEDEEFNKLVEAAFKKATENKYTLTFNKLECLYEKKQELEKPETKTEEMSVSISLSSKGRKYINLKNKSVIIEADIFGKEYLKVDSLKNYNWKMINETKKIGDYNCFKAETIITVTMKEKQEYDAFLKRQEKKKTYGLFGNMSEPKDKIITAWYTPEIPVSFGPNNYFGLPGLILEINDERNVILCTKVNLNAKVQTKIKVPNSGKKVTSVEFDKIQKTKTDSMKNEDGVIIFSEEK